MNLDRANRLFYKNVIINEKRKKDYQELDSLGFIHDQLDFGTLGSYKINKTIELSKRTIQSSCKL